MIEYCIIVNPDDEINWIIIHSIQVLSLIN